MKCIHDGGLLLVLKHDCKSSEVAKMAKRKKIHASHRQVKNPI